MYGNSKEDAIYPTCFEDEQHQKLDGTNKHALRFTPGQLASDYFWPIAARREDLAHRR